MSYLNFYRQVISEVEKNRRIYSLGLFKVRIETFLT